MARGLRWSEAELQTVLVRQGRALESEAMPQAPAISEKAFMAAVVRVATQHGWHAFHPYDSRKSARGYPDLTLARLPGRGQPGEVIWSELKVETSLTIEQEVWLATLRQVSRTEAVLWTPDDMPAIVARLGR